MKKWMYTVLTDYNTNKETMVIWNDNESMEDYMIKVRNAQGDNGAVISVGELVEQENGEKMCVCTVENPELKRDVLDNFLYLETKNHKQFLDVLIKSKDNEHN